MCYVVIMDKDNDMEMDDIKQIRKYMSNKSSQNPFPYANPRKEIINAYLKAIPVNFKSTIKHDLINNMNKIIFEDLFHDRRYTFCLNEESEVSFKAEPFVLSHCSDMRKTKEPLRRENRINPFYPKEFDELSIFSEIIFRVSDSYSIIYISLCNLLSLNEIPYICIQKLRMIVTPNRVYRLLDRRRDNKYLKDWSIESESINKKIIYASHYEIISNINYHFDL